MSNVRTSSRTVLFLLGIAVLALSTPALADTIYLKNGRVIHTAEVRIEGDKVVFRQYDGLVTIPMAVVDRIEEDEMTGPESLPSQVVQPAAESDEGEAAEGAQEGAEGEETPPEQTREYWQDRVRTIQAERQEVETRIEQLRREERAFLFSQRSTAETRQQIEDAQARLEELDQEMRDLQDQARRMQIPPGWLRVQQQGDVGGGIG